MAMPTYQVNTPQYMPLSMQTIQAASKSPFSIAGEAMTGMIRDIDKRAFEKDFRKAQSLEELSALSPVTKEQAAMVGSRANIFNALQQQKVQERQTEMQKQQLDLDSKYKNAMTTGQEYKNRLVGDALDIYNDKSRYNSLDSDAKFTVDKLLGIERKEFAPSAAGTTKLKDIWQPMTKAEVEANPSLDPTKSYQRNATGQLKEIGDAGYDVEAKRKLVKDNAKYASEQAIKNINAVRAEISNGTFGETGISGGAMSLLGSLGLQSDRTALEGYKDALESSMSLDKLQLMKSASSTGGSGLGQVTEKEHDMLKKSIASLDFSQPDWKIKKSLNDVEYYYRIIAEGKNAADAWLRSSSRSNQPFSIDSTRTEPPASQEVNVVKPSPKAIGF